MEHHICKHTRSGKIMFQSLTTHFEFIELISDGNETKMKLSAEVIRKTTIVIMDAQVCWTHLTHTQLLLLITRCRHGITVLNLQNTSSHWIIIIHKNLKVLKSKYTNSISFLSIWTITHMIPTAIYSNEWSEFFTKVLQTIACVKHPTEYSTV